MMELLSCSTLHVEFLPEEYRGKVQILWAGIGECEKGLHSVQPLSYSEKETKQCVRDVEVYIQSQNVGVMPSFSINSKNDIEQDKESVQHIQERIATGSRYVDKSSTVQQKTHYESPLAKAWNKALITAYILEEKQIALDKEYACVSEACSVLLESLHKDTISGKEEYLPEMYSYIETLWNVLPAYIGYFAPQSSVLTSSSLQMYEACCEADICTTVPKKLQEYLHSLGASHYTKGYCKDIRTLLPFACLDKPIPVLLL